MTKKQVKQTVTEVKTFTVPLGLVEIKENITITTNTPSKTSQEQIINHAMRFLAASIDMPQQCL